MPFFGTLYEHWLKIILKFQLTQMTLYMYISDGNGDFEIGRFTVMNFRGLKFEHIQTLQTLNLKNITKNQTFH